MAQPLLSIVTINRNHAAGLACTLESFRSLRDDPCLQFVFIDGASTDDSLDVARTFYKSEEITSEPDEGIYDAMNKGLGLALGTYVIWINSGDQFIPDNWDSLQLHLRGSQAALVAGGIELVSAVDARDSLPPTFLYNTRDRLPFQPLHHQAVVFRRAKAIQHRGYPLSWQITADRALIMTMYRAGEIFDFVPLLLARYEQGGLSSNALCRESEGYDLDLELGLINYGQYLIGKSRNRLYHQVTIPIWDAVKSIANRFGCRSLPRPAWLVKLAQAPRRG
jgi:putative colanic acid biosynthesis glycosyltransferase